MPPKTVHALVDARGRADWNVVLRLYGSLESRFDKTCKPGEFEPMN